MYQLDFTPTAAGHLRAYRKFEQQIILDAIALALPERYRDPATKSTHH
ncbi:hypothetical protein [Microcoleus sp. FACHB-1515]|nr:hypothetical protein [Microcoleus sp. FACHB-1515]